MENNPLTGLLGLLMLLQLAVVLMLLLGGLYALYCLNRAASGLDRLASAVETWVTQTTRAQAHIEAQNQTQKYVQSLPLPAQTSAHNADWLQPIELPNTTASSNQPAETPRPGFVTGSTTSSESEVRRD